MSLKLLGIIAAISGLLAALLFVYNLGYDSGVNSNKAIVQQQIDMNREQYDTKLKERLKKFNDDSKDAMREFKLMQKLRADTAIEMAKLELQAEEQANEITNRIPQVVQSSNCTNVGFDTFRVYRDTRRIVSDPRTTRTTDTATTTYTVN